ncbi:MAG: PhoH family protein [Clostridia bacterium]|nr:PhoH family protein [Clostridia bacterium]
MTLFGDLDKNLLYLCEKLNVSIMAKEGGLTVTGEAEDVAVACRVIEELLVLAHQADKLTERELSYVIALVKEGKSDIHEHLKDIVAITARGKPIKCKTFGQQKYVQAIKKNAVVIGVGPAGTGKTYLAVALAAQYYKSKEVEKIILTRPAVEAGEKLGFLPGDLQNKVDPYLRPLYDALQEMFGLEQYQRLMERQVIEVAPLAYMRGRTLSNAFIILDEAQNTTAEQMKMFLTRIGEGSKMVVNGDVTQIDLPDGKTSGLKHALRVLEGVEDIAVVRLSAKDVVRRELVQNIIAAYERYAKNSGKDDKK